MVISGLLNAAYWLPMIHQAFFKPLPSEPGNDLRNRPRVSSMMIGPILVCAAYVILLGAGASAPAMPFSLAEAAARFAFELEVPLE